MFGRNQLIMIIMIVVIANCNSYSCQINTDPSFLSDSHIIAQTTLTSGVPVTGNLFGTHDTKMYSIEVDVGAIYLIITLDGPWNADFDFYARYNLEPNTDDYDFRGYSADSQEYEIENNPAPGTWYVMVRSYDGSGVYELVVTITFTTSIPPTFTPTIPTYVVPMPAITESDVPSIVIIAMSFIGLAIVLMNIRQS